MNKQRKLTALCLILSLAASGSALAHSGAPASQFGFKGWPYRQSTQCRPTKAPECTAAPTPTVSPAATAMPTASPVPTKAPAATPVITAAPSAAPSPSAPPEAAPAPTAEPTARPTAVPTVKPTVRPSSKPTAAPVPPSTDDDYTTGSITAQEEIAFQLLNMDRAANGLPALTLDPTLCELARLKSRDMHENHYFAHTSPTYGSASDMLRQFGYSFTSVAENIAHHATVEKAQAAFMSSTGHRRNLLGSQWTRTGIGVWYDSQGFVYVTQLFVR